MVKKIPRDDIIEYANSRIVVRFLYKSSNHTFYFAYFFKKEYKISEFIEKELLVFTKEVEIQSKRIQVSSLGYYDREDEHFHFYELPEHLVYFYYKKEYMTKLVNLIKNFDKKIAIQAFML